MAFKDDLLLILSGGLPALVDGGTGGGTTQPVDRVEEIPPEPQLQDREAFNIGGISGSQVLFGVAALVGAVALFSVIRRL